MSKENKIFSNEIEKRFNLEAKYLKEKDEELTLELQTLFSNLKRYSEDVSVDAFRYLSLFLIGYPLSELHSLKEAPEEYKKVSDLMYQNIRYPDLWVSEYKDITIAMDLNRFSFYPFPWDELGGETTPIPLSKIPLECLLHLNHFFHPIIFPYDPKKTDRHVIYCDILYGKESPVNRPLLFAFLFGREETKPLHKESMEKILFFYKWEKESGKYKQIMDISQYLEERKAALEEMK